MLKLTCPVSSRAWFVFGTLCLIRSKPVHLHISALLKASLRSLAISCKNGVPYKGYGEDLCEESSALGG